MDNNKYLNIKGGTAIITKKDYPEPNVPAAFYGNANVYEAETVIDEYAIGIDSIVYDDGTIEPGEKNIIVPINQESKNLEIGDQIRIMNHTKRVPYEEFDDSTVTEEEYNQRPKLVSNITIDLPSKKYKVLTKNNNETKC